MVTELSKKVKQWIADRAAEKSEWSKSEWVKAIEGEIYLRWENRDHKTVVIANVSVREKGKGIFKEILATVENMAWLHSRSVVVEQVLNRRLRAHLQQKGYTRFGRLTGCDWLDDENLSLWKEQP
jgi:hypothetical protein